ncbi:MAG: MFS transporter, partial [Phycisphaerales bacterium]|nr:MFS transporter [Phycisphaerales bacterium]
MPASPATPSPLRTLLSLRPGEAPLVLWSMAYFFLLLTSYYVLRPLREAMGLTGGVRELPRLFLATLACMLVASLLFSAVASRFPRRVFIPITYGFFTLNLLVFFALFRARAGADDVWIARTFYVWVSVFNLFAVSVFWSFMVEIFDLEHGKRLFGLIGVGGTAGAILGSSTTAFFAERVGGVNLLPVSAVLLIGATACMLQLNRAAGRRATPAPAATRADDADAPVSGGVFAGIVDLVRSPFLLGIALYVFLYTVTATITYFMQGEIVAAAVPDRDARASLFAIIDVTTNVLTVVIQVFLTGRIIRFLGVGLTLAVLPLVTVGGLLALGWLPTVLVLIVFQSCRRASNYALAKPARESLFTILSREEKYKAKNFMDTFVYRSGDVAGSVLFETLRRQGAAAALGLPVLAALTVPVGIVW